MTADAAPAGDRRAESENRRLAQATAGPLAGTDRERVLAGVGTVALAAVAARTALRVLHNLPFDPVAVPGAVLVLARVGTPLVLGLALLATGAAARRPPARVGLLFAGAFGVVGVLGRGATLPAVLAVTTGGVVAIGATAAWPATARARQGVIAAGAAAGILLSLWGSVGLLGGDARGLGGLCALGALVALGVGARRDRPALATGAVVLVAVVLLAASKPYAVGSALLVGFAVTGVPHVLVAVAVAVAAAAAVAGLRRGSVAVPVGAGLLVLAGVPATLPRAMAVVLGATLVLAESRSPDTAGTTEGGSA